MKNLGRKALLIGINKYNDPKVAHLNFCVNDVSSTYTILTDPTRGRFEPDNCILMTDNVKKKHLQPIRSNIMSSIKSLSSAAEPDDYLLLFFSGHGIEENGQSYLLPADARTNVLSDSAISIDWIKRTMENSRAQAKVLILDACHTGAIKGKAESGRMTEEMHKAIFPPPEGFVILSSCKKHEFSYEMVENKQSVFTYYLNEGLLGPADFDHDGHITVSDISRYTAEKTVVWALREGAQQTPTLECKVVGDLILVDVPQMTRERREEMLVVKAEPVRSQAKVLIIYTGGIIGMVHRNNDPLQPLTNVSWKELEMYIPILKQLPIAITQVSVKKLIDSAEMRPENWIEIAEIIQQNYDEFDGFVVLHGTDTMTYTASALSFMFENLSKPVIVTGSRLPIGAPRSDAYQNLVTSIMIAAAIDNYGTKLCRVPEVCIFFGNELLRGNRARKFSETDYQGYISPNHPPLGKAGDRIEIYEKNLRKPGLGTFYVDPRIEKNVISFGIFPGTSIDLLKEILSVDGLKGVILNTYGSGNTPTDPAFLEIVAEAINERRIVIVNVTQSMQGEVDMGLHENSARLMDKGVTTGLDMSPEAALCKLSILLGKGYPPETVGQIMQINLRGEMAKSLHTVDFGSGRVNDNGVYCSSPQQIIGAAGLDSQRIVNSVLRISSLELLEDASELEFNVRVFLNLGWVNRATPETVPQFAGSARIKASATPVNLLFNTTQTVRTVIEPGAPVFVTVIADQGRVMWKKLALSIYSWA